MPALFLTIFMLFALQPIVYAETKCGLIPYTNQLVPITEVHPQIGGQFVPEFGQKNLCTVQCSCTFDPKQKVWKTTNKTNKGCIFANQCAACSYKDKVCQVRIPHYTSTDIYLLDFKYNGSFSTQNCFRDQHETKPMECHKINNLTDKEYFAF